MKLPNSFASLVSNRRSLENLTNRIVKLRVRVRVRVRVKVKVKSLKSKLDPEVGSVMG